MNVGIITFHFVNNFGGALQAYALRKTIEKKCGVLSTIVDYRNWFIRFTDTIRLFPITSNRTELRSGLATMGKRIDRIRRFHDFVARNHKLTRFYGSGIALKVHPPACDKYICGSDQIWNPFLTCGIVEPYFLGFVKDSRDKFSYAPSFGTNRLHPLFTNKMKKYLGTLGDISVREKDGIKLVKELTGRDAEQLIDPTFLLDKEEWDEIAVVPKIKEKYILLYIMQRDDSIYDYAKIIKEKLGMSLVEISRYGYKPDCVDMSLVDVGPAEFIGLFQNADYICTNSYHGFVFSLIFEKEFSLIPCKRFQIRINNLMELLNIQQPMGREGEALSISYDAEEIKKIIDRQRQKSIDYLQRNIWETVKEGQ